MTQKEFKKSMLRGQGRCILAAQSNPAIYHKLILWACSHELSYDAQCEGTRAWFVYQLISCFPDKTSFLETITQNLEHTKSDGGWKMLYLAELLSHFASDGYNMAMKALWHKYEQLYTILLNKRRRPSSLFHERDDFAMLCEVLAQKKDSFMKIAEDIGRLYRLNTIYSCYDFDWLYDSIAKRYLSFLTKKAKNSENISYYLQIGRIYEQDCNTQSNEQYQERPKKGIALSIWLNRKANGETIQLYAKKYMEQVEPEARADALTAFCRCPYPGNPLTIIEDANSNNDTLKTAAWNALANIRHPLVRQFAFDHLQTDLIITLPVIIRNYQIKDSSFLETLIKSVSVDFESVSGWHSFYLDVLRMEDNGLKPPISLLHHIFETSYCSCCRENALQQIGKRRMLTNEILQECLFDSNSDIRDYAKRCLKRRKL